MRFLILALMIAAAASPMALAAGRRMQAGDPNQSYTYRVLNNPTTGDAFGFRGAIQQNVQGMNDRMFDAVSSVLGGTAPALNFVPTGSDFAPNHMAANIKDRLGAPQGTINIDPYATAQIVSANAQDHSGWVNQIPHEQAHTRQTPMILASLANSEGGAQAFADLVAQTAAQRSNIPYSPGNYDGDYTDFVKAAQARGRDWLLGAQFGHAPVSFP